MPFASEPFTSGAVPSLPSPARPIQASSWPSRTWRRLKDQVRRHRLVRAEHRHVGLDARHHRRSETRHWERAAALMSVRHAKWGFHSHTALRPEPVGVTVEITQVRVHNPPEYQCGRLALPRLRSFNHCADTLRIEGLRDRWSLKARRSIRCYRSMLLSQTPRQVEGHVPQVDTRVGGKVWP